MSEENVTHVEVVKVSEELGLAIGWAITCKMDGVVYYDLNVDREGTYKGQRVPENIPEDEMLKASFDFAMAKVRPGNEMHKGPNVGEFAFLFPFTDDILKALEMTSRRTGLAVGYHGPPEVIAKFKSGEYRGFSIEGWHTDSELIDG